MELIAVGTNEFEIIKMPEILNIITTKGTYKLCDNGGLMLKGTDGVWIELEPTSYTE